MEGGRARRIDVRCHDKAGASEGRAGRGERKDRYREKATHLTKRIRLTLASGWCQTYSSVASFRSASLVGGVPLNSTTLPVTS